MQTNLDLYFKKDFEIGKWDINLNTNSILWDNKTKEIFEVSESFSPCIKNIITFFNRKNLILFKSLINRSMEFDTPISDKFQIITSDNKIKHLEYVFVKWIINRIK